MTQLIAIDPHALAALTSEVKALREEVMAMRKEVRTETVTEYAARTGHSESTVRRMCQTGRLKTLDTPGRNWKIVI